MRPLHRISGAPADGISQGSTCIYLPARSPALRDEGRGIFDQPEKNELFDGLFLIADFAEWKHHRQVTE